MNYTWTFIYGGSSRTLHGQMASFKFDVVGSYDVTLTVRDAAGNSDTDTVTVSVTAAPGGETIKEEVMSPLAIGAIVILAILAALFALMMILARRKKGGEKSGTEEIDVEEEAEPERAAAEETFEEELEEEEI